VTDDVSVAARIRASFAKQRFMATVGAVLERVAPGEVDIVLPFRDDLSQQHGFLHAGVLATIADSACGYAALTRMPANAAVMSVEFKLNLLAPAAGVRMIAKGRVIRSGRTLSVCTGDVLAQAADGSLKTVATMLGTMMAVVDRGLAD
jgi:uncharacterized protein (TIGR00369 family)